MDLDNADGPDVADLKGENMSDEVEAGQPDPMWEIVTREEVNELKRLINDIGRIAGANGVALAAHSSWASKRVASLELRIWELEKRAV